jgi:hypothetical protein
MGEGWAVGVGSAGDVRRGKGVAGAGPGVVEGSGAGVCVEVAVGCRGIVLAVAEGPTVGRFVLVTGAVEVAVGRTTGVAIGVGEGRGVSVGDKVGVRLGNGSGVGVGVELGSGVSVAVGSGVRVKVAVGSGVGVDVAVASMDRGTGSVKVLPPLADRSSSL